METTYNEMTGTWTARYGDFIATREKRRDAVEDVRKAYLESHTTDLTINEDEKESFPYGRSRV